MENKKKIKICFLADKHNLFDDRIYWKMAIPLKEKGFEVHYLLIRDENKKGITKEGIHYEVFELKTFSKNRYLNFILKNLNPNNNYKKLFKKSKELEADIYHFHDLWLNKIGVKLKKLKHKPIVFYDAREPYSDDYISYSVNKGFSKRIIKLFAKYVDYWEKRKSQNYDMVISNESIVRDNFRRKIGEKKANVLYNFTDNYLAYEDKNVYKKEYDFIYTGTITRLRGALKILEATLIVKNTLPNVKVVFVGIYESESFKYQMENFIQENNLENNVELHSFIEYSKISKYYNNSKVGFITPFPEPSFKIKMFIKIFEYMAFGIPIIGSDFGHIKEYLEKEKSGILINPLNEDEIAKAMVELISNEKLYSKLSENGRKATLEKYRWDFELKKLVSYYVEALDKRKELN